MRIPVVSLSIAATIALVFPLWWLASHHLKTFNWMILIVPVAFALVIIVRR